MLLVSVPSRVRLFAMDYSLPAIASLLLCSWDSPGKNTGVGCQALAHASLLQHSQASSLPLAPPGKPTVCLSLTER